MTSICENQWNKSRREFEKKNLIDHTPLWTWVSLIHKWSKIDQIMNHLNFSPQNFSFQKRDEFRNVRVIWSTFNKNSWIDDDDGVAPLCVAFVCFCTNAIPYTSDGDSINDMFTVYILRSKQHSTIGKFENLLELQDKILSAPHLSLAGVHFFFLHTVLCVLCHDDKMIWWDILYENKTRCSSAWFWNGDVEFYCENSIKTKEILELSWLADIDTQFCERTQIRNMMTY